MPKRLALATLLAAALPVVGLPAVGWPGAALAETPAAHDNIDALIEQHAKANKVPAAFVHRVVKRESNYNPRARGGSALGLMQIKHATARSMGYQGDASGLYDPDTNLKYGIAYLAAAYRAAQGDVDQAYRYYNRGFYYAAKRLGIETSVPDESVSITSNIASSANDFTKMFGLRSGDPAATVSTVKTASADPAAGVSGTPALAFAASAPVQTGAVEVPLPPARPTSLGRTETVPVGAVPVGAVPMPDSTRFATAVPAAQPGAVVSADLVEVPLPPRRPSGTMLVVVAAKPAARRSKAAEPAAEPVIEAAAAVPQQ